ncbi:HSPB1-associated protein 1-like [Corticium candelabrum]|uniref:HSPB1-associated protein 1-like n=1 Tax=Corticium candelabrum TaxID=121492 RepID=UPI002E262269|nr:HSPB1-associated protein 1-like [Corticium candelabrum]
MTRFISLCILPVIFGVIFYFQFTSFDHVIKNVATKPVAMSEWQTDSGFAEKIASRRAPRVLSNSPVLTWPAANWTPNYIATDVPYVLSKKSSKNVFKYFSTNKPLSAYVEASHDLVEVIKSGREFVGSVTSNTEKAFYYASGPVDQLGIWSDPSDISSLTVHDHDIPNAVATVHFWIGSKSVIAHMHYDTSHNFHTVVYGRKKFILMPPSEYSTLRLYPFIHPYYRQSQVNVSGDGANSNMQALTRRQEVVLYPGDTLYIPPYWFHQVESEEVTISVNIWSPSGEHAAMETTYGSRPPFNTQWNRHQLLAGAAVYIDTLLAQLETGLAMSPKEFLQSLYGQRYAALFANQLCSGGLCPIVPSHSHDSCSAYLQCPVHKLFENCNPRSLTLHAGNTARIMINSHGLDISILAINVGNFVENLVCDVLGGDRLHEIPCYYHSCLGVSSS